MTEQSESGRHSPAEELWKRTLEQIPTEYGKLVYLAALRNTDTGRYEHHGLSLMHGSESAHCAIAASHIRIFRNWLASPLRWQAEDLESYLNELPFNRATLLETWGHLEPYRNLCPVESADAEKALFCSDLETVLSLFKIGRGGVRPTIA